MKDTRDSGVPWFSNIPQHWEVSRLKFETIHIVDCLHETPPYDPEGEFPAIRTADVEPGRLLLHQAYRLTTENYLRWTERLVPVQGDILYTREGERFGIAASVPAGVRLCISQRMMLFRIRPERDSTYFMWQLNSRHVYEQASEDQVGTAAPHVNVEKIRNFCLLVPPLAEQRAIVGRISRETSHIDGLLTTKQRLLDLLAEKRKAIMATAVTRGLDPHVKLRDSGVPWLGEIPAHWAAMRVRHLISALEQGWSPEAENREPTLGEWGVLKLNAVYQGVFYSTAAKTLPTGMDPRPELEVQAGDVLITRANTPSLVGDACFVAETRPRLMLCDLIYRLRVEPQLVDARFLVHFLVTAGRLHPEMTARGTSNSMVKLSQEHIKDWWVPVPPHEEQRAIVEYIARETAKLDAVRAATERTIALLKERRSALIAAAVTGQLDVGAAA